MYADWRGGVPVLEPNLNLSRAQAWNLSCQSLSMSGVGMGLSSKLAHQEAGLIVRESGWLSAIETRARRRGSGAHRKRFILRFSCRRSFSVMWESPGCEACPGADMSTERRLSDCCDCGLSIIEPVEPCECGEPTRPWASWWFAEDDHSSFSETAGGVLL